MASNYGQIRDCVAIVEITASFQFGVLVGSNWGGGRIETSVARGAARATAPEPFLGNGTVGALADQLRRGSTAAARAPTSRAPSKWGGLLGYHAGVLSTSYSRGSVRGIPIRTTALPISGSAPRGLEPGIGDHRPMLRHRRGPRHRLGGRHRRLDRIGCLRRGVLRGGRRRRDGLRRRLRRPVRRRRLGRTLLLRHGGDPAARGPRQRDGTRRGRSDHRGAHGPQNPDVLWAGTSPGAGSGSRVPIQYSWHPEYHPGRPRPSSAGGPGGRCAPRSTRSLAIS